MVDGDSYGVVKWQAILGVLPQSVRITIEWGCKVGEAELREELVRVRMERKQMVVGSVEWVEKGYEVARLTEKIRRAMTGKA